MDKLYTSKTHLKMAGGKMYTPGPHPIPLDLPLAMSYGSHQRSLAYFSYSAPLVLLFFTKRQSQKGGAWHDALPKIRSCLDVNNVLMLNAKEQYSHNMLKIYTAEPKSN